MIKSELIAELADRTGLSLADASEFLNTALDIIKEELVAGNEVNLYGFGAFSVKTHAAHMGRNMATGAAMDLPDSRSVRFKPSRPLRELVNPGTTKS